MTIGVRGAALAAAFFMAATPAVRAQEAVRLLGEVRVRGEAERPAALDTTDAFTLLRSRIGVDATLSRQARLLLQVQDARTFGEEASTMDGSADRLDMHQAWLQYRLEGRLGVAFRAGRQQLSFGNERLVGAADWTQTARSFDGLRVSAGPAGGGWAVHTFATNVQERGRRHTGVQPDRRDHLFAGAFVEAGRVELFAFHDVEAAYRTYTGVDRTTLGGRLDLSLPRVITASAEGAWQAGNQVPAAAPSQDIRAWLLAGRLGLDTGLPVVARLGAGMDILSGDHDPADGTYRAFNTLYGTGHRYHGYLDLFLDPAGRTQERGLIDGMASARLVLPGSIALDVDAHAFWLHQELAASPDRFIGWELDLTLPVSLGDGQRLQLGYSLFRNGLAAPLVGLGAEGRTAHWAYAQVAFSLGGRLPGMLDR
jgi:hypothetical protein